MDRGTASGRSLYMAEEDAFAPAGSPAVRVHFDGEDGIVTALTHYGPSPIIGGLNETQEPLTESPLWAIMTDPLWKWNYAAQQVR